MSSVTCSTTGAVHGAIDADGFAFVEAALDARAAGAVRRALPTAERSPRAGTISSSTRTWPTAAAIGGAATPPTPLAPDGSISAQAASAALPGDRLQPAERRRRALVRADRQPRSAADRQHADDPGVLPARSSAASPAGEADGRSKSTSSGSRREPASRDARRRKGCTATASTTCWCCSSIGRTSRAGSRPSTRSTAGRSDTSRLTDPFDAALVDDTRVAHGVTPVEAIDPALPAYRDVLVVTFNEVRWALEGRHLPTSH